MMKGNQQYWNPALETLPQEKLGCEVIPGGVLNTEARILKMRGLRSTAMTATLSYVFGMAETAIKMGINLPEDLCIRKITEVWPMPSGINPN
jgi:phenylacetate-coenzyme A ligase PaaK-like adenylate-forming protein